MEMNVTAIKVLIHNTVNAMLSKASKDIKDVNSRVADVDKKVDTNTQNNTNLSTKVTNIENRLKKVTGLIVTDGDGTKFLSDDGTYKTLVIEDGGNVPKNTYAWQAYRNAGGNLEEGEFYAKLANMIG